MRGIVNAHVHLEIPDTVTPRGIGLPAWINAWRAGGPSSAEVALANARTLAATGTSAVIDISNLNVGRAAMDAAGLGGLALHEVYGFNSPNLADDLPNGTPHAPYSTHPQTIQTVARSGRCWSIHLDEDQAERDFLRDGSGPWPDHLRAFGRDLSAWTPPGLTPVRWLDALGVLGPNALLVHCTLTEPGDLELIAERDATICVCPRSNLHITGRLPNVPAMFERGVRVLVGTDSRSSCLDLDVRNDVALLREAFPQVPADRWDRCLIDDAWAYLAGADAQ